jgi:hypothetical protein
MQCEVLSKWEIIRTTKARRNTCVLSLPCFFPFLLVCFPYSCLDSWGVRCMVIQYWGIPTRLVPWNTASNWWVMVVFALPPSTLLRRVSRWSFSLFLILLAKCHTLRRDTCRDPKNEKGLLGHWLPWRRISVLRVSTVVERVRHVTFEYYISTIKRLKGTFWSSTIHVAIDRKAWKHVFYADVA